MSEHYCSDCGCQSEHKIRDWWENRSRLAWRFRRLISFRRRRRAERERAAHRADVHDGEVCDCPVSALPNYIDHLFSLLPKGPLEFKQYAEWIPDQHNKKEE